MINMNKTKKIKLNERNSKVLYETMVTLGAIKEVSSTLKEMPINEIQVHLLDEEGDGIVLCLEYDEQTGELKKTFSSIDEHYDEVEAEVLEELGLEAPHYYNENGVEELDEIAVHLDTVGDYDPPQYYGEVDEVISEKYDEVFQNSDSKKPLLN